MIHATLESDYGVTATWSSANFEQAEAIKNAIILCFTDGELFPSKAPMQANVNVRYERSLL